MVLEMVMESLFAVVDIYFVSKVGINAVATIGLTESVIMLVFAIAIGLSMAAAAMVARRIGEGKPKEAADAAWQAILLGLLISGVIGIFGFTFAPELLRAMGGSEELIAQGQNYTRWMFGGNVTIMMLFLINSVFRGAGDASLAMRTLWLANGLNIILDPILMGLSLQWAWREQPSLPPLAEELGFCISYIIYLIIKVLSQLIKKIWCFSQF